MPSADAVVAMFAPEDLLPKLSSDALQSVRIRGIGMVMMMMMMMMMMVVMMTMTMMIMMVMMMMMVMMVMMMMKELTKKMLRCRSGSNMTFGKHF